MPPLINIEIAGVNFAVESRHIIALQELPASYRNFSKGIISSHDVVNVSLELNNIPVPKMKKIFNTDQSWSMFANDSEYFVLLNPPILNGRIVWLARFKKDLIETVVYCSEMLLLENEAAGITKIVNPLSYPLDQILLMYYLSQREGALVHCAGLEYNGRGYILPGRSGAGKSTLSRQFAACNGFKFLSDDRMVVRKIDGSFFTFGTPWPGEEEIAVNKGVPLSAIFFISHGTDNKIEQLKPREALEKLLPLTSIPWYDADTMPGILTFCGDLTSYLPAYELSFKPDTGIVDVFEKFISQ